MRPLLPALEIGNGPLLLLLQQQRAIARKAGTTAMGSSQS
jgi:hypothetical protein